MKLRLRVQLTSDSVTTTHEYHNKSVRVGRNPNCDLAFTSGEVSETVSWDHAIFEFRRDGLFLRDMKSKNKTYVNDRPITKQVLRVGDQIGLGRKGPKLTVLDFTVKTNGYEEPGPGPIGFPPVKPRQGDNELRIFHNESDNPVQPLTPDPEKALPLKLEQGIYGNTRQYVLQAIEEHRKVWLMTCIAVSLVLVVLGGGMYGLLNNEIQNVGANIPSKGQDLYTEMLSSAVLIVNAGVGAKGTGALVDKERRLVITNYHVVYGANTVEIYPPRFDNNSNVIAEKDKYMTNIDNHNGIKGKVLIRDVQRDLAVVQLEKLWDGAQAIVLAAESVLPGQQVHSIGNPGNSDAFWVHTSGTVRQVYHKKWKSGTTLMLMNHEAQVVETQSPVNPGDSGGPLVNDKCEIVGVTQGYSSRSRLMSIFIDVNEVREFLKELP
jgi:pSer/pThr/pTyr-binding forkhead associated (FHA) protein